VELLRGDSELQENVVARSAAALGIPFEHVEKDYWLTECLRGLVGYASENRLRVILKGGTSLSKAFGLIRRFSEDADLIVVFGRLTEREREQHFSGFISRAAGLTGLAPMTLVSETRKGRARAVSLPYPKLERGMLIEPRVKIELHTEGGVFPHSEQVLRSLISQSWSDIEATSSLPSYPELAPLTIDVLEPCRTLVEKLVLLHEAHTRRNGNAIARQIATVRHYYDIWCLLGEKPIRDALSHEGVDVLARDVHTYSTVADFRAADRPKAGFAGSPAFCRAPTTAVATAYRNTMRSLIWPNEEVPSLEACCDRVKSLASEL
jgi:hypothetical protein